MVQCNEVERNRHESSSRRFYLHCLARSGDHKRADRGGNFDSRFLRENRPTVSRHVLRRMPRAGETEGRPALRPTGSAGQSPRHAARPAGHRGPVEPRRNAAEEIQAAARRRGARNHRRTDEAGGGWRSEVFQHRRPDRAAPPEPPRVCQHGQRPLRAEHADVRSHHEVSPRPDGAAHG